MYIQLVEYHDHWEQNDAPADIVERFSAFQDITDKYIYLLLMYQTWRDCSKDILSNRVENRFAFWKTTKCLLNYVNAIYSIKEFIENYDGKKSVIYAPMDEAFLRCDWFRIACEYRNRIIHQANILRDYDPEDGRVYLCWDELTEIQIEYMRRYAKISQEQKDRIVSRMRELSKEAKTDDEGTHFFDKDYVVSAINKEFFTIMEKVFSTILDTQLISAIDSLLSTIFQNGGVYFKTVYSNGNHKEALQPCFTLENVVIETILALCRDHPVTITLIQHLKDKGYTYFFSQESTIEKMLTTGIKAEQIHSSGN